MGDSGPYLVFFWFPSKVTRECYAAEDARSEGKAEIEMLHAHIK